MDTRAYLADYLLSSSSYRQFKSFRSGSTIIRWYDTKRRILFRLHAFCCCTTIFKLPCPIVSNHAYLLSITPPTSSSKVTRGSCHLTTLTTSYTVSVQSSWTERQIIKQRRTIIHDMFRIMSGAKVVQLDLRLGKSLYLNAQPWCIHYQYNRKRIKLHNKAHLTSTESTLFLFLRFLQLSKKGCP